MSTLQIVLLIAVISGTGFFALAIAGIRRRKAAYLKRKAEREAKYKAAHSEVLSRMETIRPQYPSRTYKPSNDSATDIQNNYGASSGHGLNPGWLGGATDHEISGETDKFDPA